jgi:GTP-binding protein
MVVGENARDNDMPVNVCKTKQLTNVRAVGSDEAVRIEPPRLLSLEQAIEWLGNDEYLEITPKNIRIRKKVLDHNVRGRAEKQRSMAAAAAR